MANLPGTFGFVLDSQAIRNPTRRDMALATRPRDRNEFAFTIRPGDREGFEIALFCVLKPERDAVELAFEEQYEINGFSYGRSPGDSNIYTLGRLGYNHVVLVYLPEIGNIGSAAAAPSVRASFPGIKLALVVGVCGISPHGRTPDDKEILLGDVIISTTVVKTSSGRQYSDGLALRTSVEDTLGRATPQVRAFLNQLEGISALGRLKEKTATYSETILDKGLRSTGAYPGIEKDNLYSSEYRHKHRLQQECTICAACKTPSDSVCQDALESSCAELGCDTGHPMRRTRLEEARESDLVGPQPYIWFGKFASSESVLKSGYHRDKLVKEQGVIAFEMEGAGIWDYLPTIIVKGACDYADSHKNKSWQQYSAITAAACAKAIVEEWKPQQQSATLGLSAKRRLSLHNDREDRRRLRSSNPDEMGDVENVAFSHNTHYTPTTSDIIQTLNGIPHVDEASFDSLALQNTSTCLKDTRVALLNIIYRWATKKDSPPVFWLRGIAGTGKTTIAKTVAETFSREKALGASFFFSRGAGDRGNAEKFFSTLLYQLTQSSILDRHHMADVQSTVYETIKSTPGIFKKAYREQWENLVLGPLLLLEERKANFHRKPVVIVIDAIDECDPIHDIGIIIDLFLRTQKLKAIPLRFFLTGRPDISINYRFDVVKENVEQIILHNIESSVVNADILAFVKHEFIGIRQKFILAQDWPSEKELREIALRADGLFIYAMAVCRFVGRQYPKLRLSDFLRGDVHDKSQLNHIYNTILVQSVGAPIDDATDDIAVRYFKLVIGSLAVLFDELSVNTLYSLLTSRIDHSDDASASVIGRLDHHIIHETLQRLGSVLDIPSDRDSPIRIFHPSFREFLLGERKTSLQYLQLDSRDLHEVLLNSCLASMNKCLRKDICGLSDPAVNPDSLSASHITRHLPLHVQYACKYWFSHIQKLSAAGLQIALADKGPVNDFFRRKIVYWMEAMSFLNLVPNAVTTIASLRSLLKDDEHPDTFNLIRDSYRFLVNNRAIIEIAPLQIYCSALLFSPSSSVIKELFAHDIPSWLLKSPDVPASWNSSVALEAQGMVTLCVDFSPDGKLLAAGDVRGSILFWDVATGFLNQILNSHISSVTSVAFSPDGQTLMSASMDGTVCLWNVSTGFLLHTLDGFSEVYGHVAFSHNGLFIATGHDQAKIFHLGSFDLQHTLDGHTGYVVYLSFSLDDSTVITSSTDGKVRMFDRGNGKLRKIFGTGSDSLLRITCCYESIIFGYSTSVCRWDTTNDSAYEVIQIKEGVITSLELSSDAKLLAIGTVSEPQISVWDMKDLSLKFTLTEHSSDINRVKFSPDDQLLAFTSEDGTVRIWDLNENISRAKFGQHQDVVEDIKVSPDRRMIASSSPDGTVRVLDFTTEKVIYVLNHDSTLNKIDFAPDGTKLAVSSDDGPIFLLDTYDWSSHALPQPDIARESIAVTFSPDARFLAAIFHRPPLVLVWNTSSWELVEKLDLETKFLSAVQFSPDSKTLACAHLDDVYLIDLENRFMKPVFNSPGDFIYDLTFSLDGQKLICRTDEGRAFHWDLSTMSMEKTEDNFLITHKTMLPGVERNWSIQKRWVTFSGNNILYLPEDRQVQSCDIFDNTILIGSLSGVVTILRFRDDLERFVV